MAVNPPKPFPRLRLFLSADIVNSTAFKQRSGGDDTMPHPWLSTFNDFYVSIQYNLDLEYSNLLKQDKLPKEVIGECPSFWKASGDEVILVQHITHLDQPYITICLFLQVIRKLRMNIRSAGMGLDIKLTAWLAGFPINNAEFLIGNDRSKYFPGKDDYDYSHYVYLENYYKKDADLDMRSAEKLDFI